MEQFNGAIVWYHFMAPFYGVCVLGIMYIYTYNFIHHKVANNKQ